MALGEFKAVVMSAGLRVPVLITSAACSLVTTRLLIGHGGVDTYAFAALLFSLTALLPFADLGVGAAVVNAVAESKDPSADQYVHRVMVSAARVLVLSASLVIVLAAVVGVFDGWSELTGQSAPDLRYVDLAVWLALSFFAAGLPLGLAQRVLLGTDRSHLLVLTSGLTAPFALILTWVAITGGMPQVLWGVAIPAGTFLAGLATWETARRYSGLPVRAIIQSIPRFRRLPGVPLRRTAVPMAIIMAGMPIALQSDRLILSHQSTTGQLAIYSLAMQLFSPILAVLSTGATSLWPVFARRRAHGISAHKPMFIALAAIMLLATGGTTLMVAVGPWMAQLLSKGEVAISAPVLLMFGALVLVQAMHVTLGAALTSEDGLRFQSLATLAMVPSNLALSWILAGELGAMGPVLASTVTMLAALLLPNSFYFMRDQRNLHASSTPSPAEV